MGGKYSHISIWKQTYIQNMSKTYKLHKKQITHIIMNKGLAQTPNKGNGQMANPPPYSLRKWKLLLKLDTHTHLLPSLKWQQLTTQSPGKEEAMESFISHWQASKIRGTEIQQFSPYPFTQEMRWLTSLLNLVYEHAFFNTGMDESGTYTSDTMQGPWERNLQKYTAVYSNESAEGKKAVRHTQEVE